MGLTCSSCCAYQWCSCNRIKEEINTSLLKHNRHKQLSGSTTHSYDYNMQSKENAQFLVFGYFKKQEIIHDIIIPDGITTLCCDYFCKLYIINGRLKAFIDAGDSIYEDMARFMRTIPPQSKLHIWKHAVRIKMSDGKKQHLAETKNKTHVNRLICDCIIVYLKYLDRDAPALKLKMVQSFVESPVAYIYSKYHPLNCEKFQHDEMYFAAMLDDYIQSQTDVI